MGSPAGTHARITTYRISIPVVESSRHKPDRNADDRSHAVSEQDAAHSNGIIFAALSHHNEHERQESTGADAAKYSLKYCLGTAGPERTGRYRAVVIPITITSLLCNFCLNKNADISRITLPVQYVLEHWIALAAVVSLLAKTKNMQDVESPIPAPKEYLLKFTRRPERRTYIRPGSMQR